MELNFAYSPCPNDTFAFCGIAAGRVPIGGHQVKVHHHDIETLNTMAFEGRHEISKMSFHAWLLLSGRYRILSAGNALGFGCGPLLVARRAIDTGEIPDLRIVLPGEHTTAHLLFRLFCPQAARRYFTSYEKIFGELISGRADCGVVIHESRFLCRNQGLHTICDLGEWWEQHTGTPVPLGAVAIRNDLPGELDSQVETAIRASLALARTDPATTMPYIKKMAMETDDTVIEKHITTFVNNFTSDLGETGTLAIARLRELAIKAGLIP